MIKKIVVILGALIALIVFGSAVMVYRAPATLTNTSVSGKQWRSQTWSGTITVTGDTLILGKLILQPGTIVRFMVGDDQKSGDEVPDDGYNDNDPTRLKAYTTTHSGLLVLGQILANGTASLPITFTSAGTTPHLADWEAIIFRGNTSIFDHVIVEYSRNGINPIGNQPDSVVQNSLIRHTMWGAISSGHSPIQVINNQISDCGHEGVDVQSGNQIIRGNTIEDCHAGIVVLGGAPTIENNLIQNTGDGIHVDPQARPKLNNNTINLAHQGQTREWRYGDFAYHLFGNPTIGQ